MSHVLSFSVEPLEFVDPHPEDSDCTEKYLYLDIQPLVDGEPLLRSESPVFDTSAVLARRSDAAHFDIFTCTCGVAGCAGIHDYCEQKADEKTVTWTLPEEWFRNLVNEKVFPEGEPLVLTFDKAQYETALDELVEVFHAIEKEEGMPVVFTPGSIDDNYILKPLDEKLRDEREFFLERQAREEWYANVFGKMRFIDVKAVFANGWVYAMSVPGLAFAVADAAGIEYEDMDDFVESRVMPAFRLNPHSILDIFRGFSWDDISDSLSLMKYKESDAETSDEALAAMWETAEVSFHTGDYR